MTEASNSRGLVTPKRCGKHMGTRPGELVNGGKNLRGKVKTAQNGRKSEGGSLLLVASAGSVTC